VRRLLGLAHPIIAYVAVHCQANEVLGSDAYDSDGQFEYQHSSNDFEAASGLNNE